MAGHGPPPKPAGQRRRKNKPKVEPVDLDLEAAGGVPEGPPEMPEGEWSPWVRHWWDSWVSAPQAKLFTPPTWRALELMVTLAQAAHDGRMAAIKELRLWEKGLGALPMDLRRGGVEVREKTSAGRERPSGGPESPSGEDRRLRVLKALESGTEAG